MNLDADIAALDLECVAFKVVWDEKWSLAEIDQTTLDYRWFLQATRIAPKRSLMPSKRVDIFWHHHILDTRKYTDDCLHLFGKYIHHFPYAGVMTGEDTANLEQHAADSEAFILSLRQSSP